MFPCGFVYVYVCVRLCICVCVSLCAFACVCTFQCVCVCFCVVLCMCMCVSVFVFALFAYMRVCVSVCICVCLCVWTASIPSSSVSYRTLIRIADSQMMVVCRRLIRPHVRPVCTNRRPFQSSKDPQDPNYPGALTTGN